MSAVTGLDDVDLVALVTQGDASAFSEVVDRHLACIEIYAKRIIGDDALAQDVAQETMLILWQRSADFDARKARLTTWLHRIAHNRSIDLLRRRKRETPVASDEMFDRAEAGPLSNKEAELLSIKEAEPHVNTYADGSESALINRGLQALPESQRTALVLTYYQNLSNREVAQVMNISIRAVESLLVRARGNLKKQLETQL